MKTIRLKRKMALSRKPLLKEKAQYIWYPCTN